MRDLEKDLDEFNELYESEDEFTSVDIAEFAGTVLPHAIQRAIAAEKRVKELEGFYLDLKEQYKVNDELKLNIRKIVEITLMVFRGDADGEEYVKFEELANKCGLTINEDCYLDDEE